MAPEIQSDSADGNKFKKDITWQDREFDFAGEKSITLDSAKVQKIHYTVKMYMKAPYDCCEVQISFLDKDGNELAVIKSHEVPIKSAVTSYTASSLEDFEVLQQSEMIIGARVNQDQKGANTSIQFLIAQQDPSNRKKGTI